jgi:hypothetical protein
LKEPVSIGGYNKAKRTRVCSTVLCHAGIHFEKPVAVLRSRIYRAAKRRVDLPHKQRNEVNNAILNEVE